MGLYKDLPFMVHATKCIVCQGSDDKVRVRQTISAASVRERGYEIYGTVGEQTRRVIMAVLDGAGAYNGFDGEPVQDSFFLTKADIKDAMVEALAEFYQRLNAKGGE
jgi:hypothetical protein